MPACRRCDLPASSCTSGTTAHRKAWSATTEAPVRLRVDHEPLYEWSRRVNWPLRYWLGVGHSYTVYGPHTAARAYVEGKPVVTTRCRVFWRGSHTQRRISFTAPTTFRAINAKPNGKFPNYDLSNSGPFPSGDASPPIRSVGTGSSRVHHRPLVHPNGWRSAPLRRLGDSAGEPGRRGPCPAGMSRSHPTGRQAWFWGGALVCKFPLPPGPFHTLERRLALRSTSPSFRASKRRRPVFIDEDATSS